MNQMINAGEGQESKARILIVDDRPENLLALSTVLSDSSYELVTARSGKEALRRILEDDFAVILLDVQMPVMDGFETAQLIRQRETSRLTPIIFLTAVSTDEQQIASGYRAGAVDYMVKPFIPDILRAKVAIFVELARKTELVKRQNAMIEQRSRELERANAELQAEVAHRRRAEQALARRAAQLAEANRRLEETNRELEKLYNRVRELDHLKSEFFANVSHELRTPLTLMLGPTLDKLRGFEGLNGDQHQALDIIERNARILLKHVNDLLELSRMDAGKLAPSYEEIDLAGLVRLTCGHFEPLSAERTIQFDVDAPPSLPAQVDGDKVQRILLNLLSNAFKFTAPGGQVTCRVHPAGDFAQIEVEDNGPGIPAEFRSLVFERFRQLDSGPGRQFGGTGLGLSIARQLAELHSGAIDLQEAPGGGALFRVTLPLHAPEQAEVRTAGAGVPDSDMVGLSLEELRSQPHGAPIEGRGEGLVLVVEDHPIMNRFICELLAGQHRVAAAHSGAEALEKAAQERPDLVIADIMMPGMNGEEMLRLLRSQRSLEGVPVLVLTARDDDDLRHRLLANQAQDYMLKPFAPEELRLRVANLVRMKRLRDLLMREVSSQEHDIVALARDMISGKQELERALTALAESESELKRYAGELERRVQERTAELRDKNSQLEHFAHTIAHDLRAPLRAIRGFAEAMVEDHGAALTDPVRAYAQRIVDAADRMDRLTSDLLLYSSLSNARLEVQPADLEGAIGEAIAQLEDDLKKRGATVSVEVDDELRPVRAHHPTLIQVLVNLLSNAVKFVDEGRPPVVQISAERSGGRTRLWVADNGIGIAPEYHEKIFEVFERLHGSESYPGTGVGLAIVRKGVERMGGRAGLESAPGQGSRFWIELSSVGGQSEHVKSHRLAG